MLTNISAVIKLLKQSQLPKEYEVKNICNKVKEILLTESNVIQLQAPITICGDIHGQYNDLLELFEVGGSCPTTNYLFMGDYVDRGFEAVETILLLLSLKIKYPDRINLLRGNHESRQITQVYGFYDECIRKYNSINVWKYCMEVFDTMPLAGIINGKVFCVHGGLTPDPDLPMINDINRLDRIQEMPHQGAMCDLLWSDPDENIKGYEPSPRGGGFLFGEDVVRQYVHKNNITLIARAHQLMMEGYKYIFNKLLVTVWSAPNYCYRCGNNASILELDENLEQTFKIFEAAPEEMRNVQSNKTVLDYFL